MNNKQILAIGVGTALDTSIGVVTNNIALSTVYGGIIGTIISVVIALTVLKKIDE